MTQLAHATKQGSLCMTQLAHATHPTALPYACAAAVLVASQPLMADILIHSLVMLCMRTQGLLAWSHLSTTCPQTA